MGVLREFASTSAGRDACKCKSARPRAPEWQKVKRLGSVMGSAVAAVARPRRSRGSQRRRAVRVGADCATCRRIKAGGPMLDALVEDVLCARA
jgi:hypothetical protein